MQASNRRRRILAIAACVIALNGGCQSSRVSWSGNRPFTTSISTVRPSGTEEYALTQAPYKLSLQRITVNDIAGNDFERAILANAGLLKDEKPTPPQHGSPIAASRPLVFTAELEEKIEGAIASQANYNKTHPASGGSNISVSETKEAIFAAINKKLGATYTVTIDANVRAFALNSSDKKFQVIRKLTQNSLSSPITTDSSWDELLFRGTGFDIIELDTKFARTSLLSEQYQRQVEKLKDSNFFADSFAALLSSFLPAVGASVGKEIGAAIDKSVYRTVKNKYAPSFEIGSGQAIFVTAHKFSASELATPSPETGLFEGETSINLVASFKDRNETANLLNFKLKVEPIRPIK